MTDRLKGKRIAIYARYSSSLQRETSIEDQVRRCKEHVERDGGHVEPALVFADAAASGANLARPAFERMMQLVEARKVDVIVTEDMSRISRDFADSAQIFQHLRWRDVPLIGVADGIDTSAKNAKVAFTIKSLVSDLYLDDLRDKTLRGLEGRALAGFATGGLALGYRSVPEVDAAGRTIGNRIEIDEETASVVRRIFRLYVDGRSLEVIARLLNDEGVPPPRAKTRHRRKGWVASTIRVMLHNAAYVGEWTYKRTQWLKVPGTNARRPKRRPVSEAIRTMHPERRIIDEATWTATRLRLAAVRACYVKSTEGATRASGRQNRYLLSGILRCGLCGAAMTIHAGTSASYYRCSDGKKRGTCSNRTSLREDHAREHILAALRERLRSPAELHDNFVRLSTHLHERAGAISTETGQRSERLAELEGRIRGLMAFVMKGDQSDYVRRELLDLEAAAKAEKSVLADLQHEATRPLSPPTLEEFATRAQVLEQLLDGDPLAGREALTRMFVGGRLLCRPEAEGWVIQGDHLPIAMMVEPKSKAREPAGSPGSLTSADRLWSSHGCAGRN